MKRKILIITIIILGLVLVSLSGYIIYDNNRIAATIIMDINPSIEISLNKKGNVLKVTALNSDAKEIVVSDYKCKELETVVEEIADNVISKGYVEDKEVVILLNTKGNVSTDKVEKVIENKFVAKEVECNIVVQETKKDAHENAEKYNISESKASYIEEIIENNKDLNFEDLKDKSIKELNELKTNNKENEEEEVKEESEPIEQKVTESNSAPVIRNNYTNPPSDPSDTSGAWCTWNKNRPQNSTFTYDGIMDISRAKDIIFSHLGLQDFDAIGIYGANKDESRSSYCIALYYIVTTRDIRRTVVIDSVKGNIIEEYSESVPSPKYTSDEALQIFLDRFSLNKDDCDVCSSSYGTDMEGSPQFVYRYSVGLLMKDGTQHVGSVNALTGEIYGVAY